MKSEYKVGQKFIVKKEMSGTCIIAKDIIFVAPPSHEITISRVGRKYLEWTQVITKDCEIIAVNGAKLVLDEDLLLVLRTTKEEFSSSCVPLLENGTEDRDNQVKGL